MIVLDATLERGPSGPRLSVHTSDGPRVLDLDAAGVLALEAGALLMRKRLAARIGASGVLFEDQVAAESCRLTRDLSSPVPQPADC